MATVRNIGDNGALRLAEALASALTPLSPADLPDFAGPEGANIAFVSLRTLRYLVPPDIADQLIPRLELHFRRADALPVEIEMLLGGESQWRSWSLPLTG